MAEYIQSNDDSSNLALYAGIGLFAGGAALAYRMSRDPSKGATATGTGTKGGKNGLVMKYDGEKPASAWRGGAKALLGGQWSKGMSEFAQAAIDKSTATSLAANFENSTKPNAVGKKGILQEIGNAGSKAARESDLQKALDVIDNGGNTKKGKPKFNAESAHEQVLLENPYSAITPEDIQKRLDRRAKKEDKVALESEWNKAQNAHQQQQAKDASKSNYKEQKRLEAEEAELRKRVEARTGTASPSQIETEADRGRKVSSFEQREQAAANRQQTDRTNHKPGQASAHRQFAQDARAKISAAMENGGSLSKKQFNSLVNQAQKVGLSEKTVNDITTRLQNQASTPTSVQRTPVQASYPSTFDATTARAGSETFKPQTPMPTLVRNKNGTVSKKEQERYNKARQARSAEMDAHYVNRGAALRNDLRARGHKIGNKPKVRGGFAKMLAKAL